VRVIFQPFENVSDCADLLHAAVSAGLDKVLDRFVQTEGIMLVEKLESGAFDYSLAYGNEGLAQLLYLLIGGVVELATTFCIRAVIADLLRSLEGDFEVAFALVSKDLVIVDRLEDPACEFRGQADVTIYLTREHGFRVVGGAGPASGMEMTATIRMKNKRPLCRVEGWV